MRWPFRARGAGPAAAHARGLQVTGHIPVHMLAHEAVKAGYDGIEHVNMLFLNFFATHETDTRDTTRFTLVGDRAASLDLRSKPVLDFFELLRKRRTVIDPTLDAFEELFVAEQGKIVPGLEDVVARLPVTSARKFLMGGLPVTSAEHRERYRVAYDKLLAMVKALHDAKIQIVLGTDHIGGLMLHHEMALFARAGIPPATILQLATVGAARVMRLGDKVAALRGGRSTGVLDEVALFSGPQEQEMTFKIRKLYNVLVVGGMIAAGTAACKKDDKKTTEPTQAAEPAKADPAAAAPPAAEPAKTDPAAVAPTAEPPKADPAAATPAKAEPAKPAPKKKDAAKTEPKKDAKKDDKGDGVQGWS